MTRHSAVFLVPGLVTALLCSSIFAEAPKFSQKDLQFFEARIRPILIEHCYQCHSTQAASAEGGLLVDSRDALLQGGDSGPAVVVGDPKRSLLMKAIAYEDSDIAMPPKDAGGKMDAQEIADIAEWIKRGLADPRKRTTKDREQEDYRERKEWWSFQPMKQPHLPNANSSWAWNEIDQFVEQQIAQRGLQTSPYADANVLLRRITFDLTGLPPSIQQQEMFYQQVQELGQQKAYEKYVDQLLESPAYAEHWGRHWLDVARYAESSGREVNVVYPYAWRYRDWVIKSFEEDKPYDQFLREQIAGDLLPTNNDQRRAENQIATGFLALGSRGLNEMQPRQFAVDQADEQIDATFQASMALTVSCARCHDHKFDPIPQTDYTAVAGIFLSTKTHFGTIVAGQARNNSDYLTLEGNHRQPILHSAIATSEVAKLHEELDEIQVQFRQLRQELNQKKQSPPDMSKSDSSQRPMLVSQSNIRERNRLEARLKDLQNEIAKYNDQGESLALAMGVSDKTVPAPTSLRFGRQERRPGKGDRKDAMAFAKAIQNRRAGFETISDSPLFARGDIDLPGERIPRGVPATLGHSPNFDVPNDSSGRLQLARWITRPNNSFTARVAVNRTWAWLFGEGIVTSLDNFGTTGATPSHPELLDYLALKFVSEGWSTKKLIRFIVTSHTYQQSSQFHESNFIIDPDNTSLWRMHSKRLGAEAIHDSVLQLSQSLEAQRALATTLARQGEGLVNRRKSSTGRRTEKEALETEPRAIFLPLPRDALPDILEIFDSPDATVVQSKRDVTNVPSQSLYLLNNP